MRGRREAGGGGARIPIRERRESRIAEMKNKSKEERKERESQLCVSEKLPGVRVSLWQRAPERDKEWERIPKNSKSQVSKKGRQPN